MLQEIEQDTETSDPGFNAETTSIPTFKPMSAPQYLGFETTIPRSTTPSPALRPLSEPFPPREEIQTFSERLMVKNSSAPGRLIDPFHVEIRICLEDCPPTAKRDLGEMIKIVLEEIHVVPDPEYIFNGHVVLCYTVYPYRTTVAQVQRLNLGYELAWKARAMWKSDLALALSRAFVQVLPHGAAPLPSLGGVSCSELPPLPSEIPYLEPQSSDSSYKKLVQPAVTNLVNKTKKKRAKGLPKDYRARQNLVQLKHNTALALLRPWLLDESEEKIYLRGDNVAFIQVKCPRALHVVDDFLERILNDESIEIEKCTAPLSRKRQGQLKGYLLYLQCKTAANVARIDEIFNQGFADSGLKCKTARFEKRAVPASDSSESSV